MRSRINSLLLCLYLICMWGHAQAQFFWEGNQLPWNSHIYRLYNDSSEQRLLIGGRLPSSGGPEAKSFAVYSDTGYAFVPWTIGIAPSRDFARYQDELFVAGNGGVLVWHGGDSVTVPGGGIKGKVMRLRVHDDVLYAFGQFDSAGTQLITNNMAKWDGTSWSKVGNYPNDNDGFDINIIADAVFYKDMLYIGGVIFDGNGNCSILEGDGQHFSLPANGLRGPFAQVEAMMVSKDTLWVGGLFEKIDGNAGNGIIKWDGFAWHDVGGGITSGLSISGMNFIDDKLFALGAYDSIGGICAKGIAYWQNNQWCSMGGDFDNSVLAIERFHDTLWVGGAFDNIGSQGIHSVAQWTGGSYTDTCGNIISGITESENLHPSLRIYPNPAQGSITLVFDDPGSYPVEIFDFQGNLVHAASIRSGDKLNLSALASGIYVLRCEGQTHKIIKN